jgi:hypothetical protein
MAAQLLPPSGFRGNCTVTRAGNSSYNSCRKSNGAHHPSSSTVRLHGGTLREDSAGVLEESRFDERDRLGA